jgi:hypothetical protein
VTSEKESQQSIVDIRVCIYNKRVFLHSRFPDTRCLVWIDRNLIKTGIGPTRLGVAVGWTPAPHSFTINAFRFSEVERCRPREYG